MIRWSGGTQVGVCWTRTGHWIRGAETRCAEHHARVTRWDPTKGAWRLRSSTRVRARSCVSLWYARCLEPRAVCDAAWLPPPPLPPGMLKGDPGRGLMSVIMTEEIKVGIGHGMVGVTLYRHGAAPMSRTVHAAQQRQSYQHPTHPAGSVSPPCLGAPSCHAWVVPYHADSRTSSTRSSTCH